MTSNANENISADSKTNETMLLISQQLQLLFSQNQIIINQNSATNFYLGQLAMYMSANEIRESYRSASNKVLKGFKVYSQSDEDGILHGVFERIGIDKGYFIEIGVENGIECNSRLLLQLGWNGLWIEGSSESCSSGGALWVEYIKNGQLTILNEFVTAENINLFIDDTQKSLDLLSIDVDGNDFYIWKSCNVRPKVVIIEYNAKFPPPISVVQPYDSKWAWDHRTDDFGASFSALVKLGEEKGYFPVACSASGCNIVFVSDEFDSLFPRVSPQELYFPARYDLISAPSFSRGHQAGKMIFERY